MGIPRALRASCVHPWGPNNTYYTDRKVYNYYLYNAVILYALLFQVPP